MYRLEDDAQMPNECSLTWLGLARLRTDVYEQKALLFISSSSINVRMGELYTNVCYLKGVRTTENKLLVFAKKRTVAVITLDIFCL